MTTTTKPRRTPATPPPRDSLPLFDGGGDWGDMIPFPEFVASIRPLLDTFCSTAAGHTKLVEKWTTTGFRSPCGRMFQLTTIQRDGETWVPLAAGQEFIVLITLNTDPYPPSSKCACPVCVGFGPGVLGLLHDPRPEQTARTEDGAFPFGYGDPRRWYKPAPSESTESPDASE